MFFKRGVLKHFATLTGKHLCWSLFLMKETPTLVFLYIFRDIKEQVFYRAPPVAASNIKKKTSRDSK